MVKSIISIGVVIILLLVSILLETNFVKKQFLEAHQATTLVYEKTLNETATEDDVYKLQKDWLNKKRYLHIFIPHNEIKEVDLWISECVKLVKNKEWTDAITKLEVLKELFEQIPKTFKPSIENIL